ncbi:MAG: hypothetical protein CMD74_01965 [Gammaproteobacteria bacterium]|nr:hypothetical protein [Gammaproteobacteria bacterium]
MSGLIGLILLLTDLSFMRIIDTSLDTNLASFSAWLWSQKIEHRIFEERGRQVLELSDSANASIAVAAYVKWKKTSPLDRGRANLFQFTAWFRHVRRMPALSILVFITLFVFPFTLPLAGGHLTRLCSLLLIFDPVNYGDKIVPLVDVVMQKELWRLITPVFIHFNIMHLMFNLTVIIYFGRLIEKREGSAVLFFLFMFASGISNFAQYAVSANPFFGGLSGVAYGFLGFVIVMRFVRGSSTWPVTAGLINSLLFFLVLFTTGIIELFFDNIRIANTAHWTGLVTGLIFSLFFLGHKKKFSVRRNN